MWILPTASPRRLVRWLVAHRAVSALTATALVFGGIGTAQFTLLLRDRSAPGAQASADIGGLSAAVNDAGWLDMDMDNPPGYQMPAAMNPGMPAAGTERLALTVTVVNTTKAVGSLHPTDEFTMRTAKDGKRWTSISGTFGDLPRLAPGNGVTGLLYFDLPTADVTGADPYWLDWSRQGGTRELRIPLPGETPAHSHT